MSFELPLIEAGIEIQHIKNNTTVPMYRTSIECEPAGQFQGKDGGFHEATFHLKMQLNQFKFALNFL